MAFTNFFVQVSGSNANAGSTTAAPVYSSGSTAWINAANTITITGDGSALALGAGQWLNIGGGYVAQITLVTGGPANFVVTVSTTAVYGTKPADNATIAVVSGGPWADLTQSIIAGTTTVPASTIINVKADMSMTLGGNATLGLKGTTIAPLWYRGYNATPGDLDNGSTALAYPAILCSINTLTFGGGFCRYTGLAVSGNPAGVLAQSATAAPQFFRRCDFTNTGTGTGPKAFNVGVAQTFMVDCYFKTNSNANQIITTTVAAVFEGCYFAGTASGSTQVGLVCTGSTTMNRCAIVNCGSHGLTTTSLLFCNECTFVGSQGDHIRITSVVNNSGPPPTITNNVFANAGGFDINNSSGTNTAVTLLDSNLSYNPASGHLNGFGDWNELGAQVDTLNPLKSVTDFHLIPTSAGAGTGIPGQWENAGAGVVSNPDIGAFQTVGAGEAGAGGGGRVIKHVVAGRRG